MKETAPPEAVGCIIDSGQKAKGEILGQGACESNRAEGPTGFAFAVAPFPSYGLPRFVQAAHCQPGAPEPTGADRI